MTEAEKLVEAVARAQFDAWVEALCPDWDFSLDGPSPLTPNGMTFREYHELQAEAAISAIEAAGYRIDEEETVRNILIGGNHLATVLISLVGTDFSETFPPETDPSVVLHAMPHNHLGYNVWCAWSAIMKLAAAPKVVP